MSFAVIETGGKQYKVSASNILKVEKLDIQKGKKVEFKKVLLVNDDKTTEVGNPTISGAIVEGLLLDNIFVIVWLGWLIEDKWKKNGLTLLPFPPPD